METSFIGRLAGYWKVFVPALTVCVVLFIYMREINTPQLPVTEKKMQITPSDTPINKLSAGNEIIRSENPAEENYFFLDEVFSDDAEANTQNQKRIKSFNTIPGAVADENVPVIDYAETGTIFGRDEEMQTQEEYDNLSIDEQMEILQSLKDKTF
jgi:hypothetical protein